MYINSTGFYIPAARVANSYFLNVNGLTDEWILKRTGISTRSKASKEEGHNSMGLNAIEDALDKKVSRCCIYSVYLEKLIECK